MTSFLEKIQSMAAQDQVSQTKAFISEIQKIFLEEFFASPYSKGWILIGGANLKFTHGQKRCTKDIDLGYAGEIPNVHETLESLKFLEHTLEKRTGYSAAIKIDEEKTSAHIFVHCNELGGLLGFEVEFTQFLVLEQPEKAKLGSVLILGSCLSEMKVSKILSLLLRPQIEVRDLFDIFSNPESIRRALLQEYFKKFKKNKSDLRTMVEHIQKNLSQINQKLIQELQEDLGLSETKKYISGPSDTALIQRVLREINGVL